MATVAVLVAGYAVYQYRQEEAAETPAPQTAASKSGATGMDAITYKIIGARGEVPAEKKGHADLVNVAELAAVSHKGRNFGSQFSLEDFTKEISQKKIVFFGEVHAVEKIVKL